MGEVFRREAEDDGVGNLFIHEKRRGQSSPFFFLSLVLYEVYQCQILCIHSKSQQC